MATSDNRIRFSAAKINFETEVGVSGQEHDSYPAAGQQPRFDWMRMFLIGLLSCQSSAEEPTQYREGALWFDTTENVYKCRRNGAWVSAAQAIKLDNASDGSLVSLSDLYTTIRTLIGNKPTASFGGTCANDGVTSIPIPESLRSAGGSGSRAFVYVEGLLLDPRKCVYSNSSAPASIALIGGEQINSGERFTVVMLNVDTSLFSTSDVVL